MMLSRSFAPEISIIARRNPRTVLTINADETDGIYLRFPSDLTRFVHAALVASQAMLHALSSDSENKNRKQIRTFGSQQMLLKILYDKNARLRYAHTSIGI